MSDIEQVLNEAKPFIPFVAKILAHLGIGWKGSQTSPNQDKDVAAIKELEASGIPVSYFKGPTLEIEAFQHASNAEAERLAVNTFNAVSKAYPPSEWHKVNFDGLSPEFLHQWTGGACNVSDETLQTLWGQLLKGELDSPGSVSNDTISIARDMNKARAEEFQLLCSAALYDFGGNPSIVVGLGNPGGNSLQPYGLSYDVLMRLAHHRLISNEMSSYRRINGGPVGPIYLVRHQDQAWLMQSSADDKASVSSLDISGILFSPAGQELGRVVQQIAIPEYTKAMFEYLKKQGWHFSPVSVTS